MVKKTKNNLRRNKRIRRNKKISKKNNYNYKRKSYKRNRKTRRKTRRKLSRKVNILRRSKANRFFLKGGGVSEQDMEEIKRQIVIGQNMQEGEGEEYIRTKELGGINDLGSTINLIQGEKLIDGAIGNLYEGTADIPDEGGRVRVAIKHYDAFLPHLSMRGQRKQFARAMWYLALEEEQKIKDKKVTLNRKQEKLSPVIKFGQLGKAWVSVQHLYNPGAIIDILGRGGVTAFSRLYQPQEDSSPKIHSDAVAYFSKQILLQIAEMHDPATGICTHGDLRLENICLNKIEDGHYQARVIDFDKIRKGSAKFEELYPRGKIIKGGTALPWIDFSLQKIPEYCSPAMQKARLNSRMDTNLVNVDLYCMAMCIYHMLIPGRAVAASELPFGVWDIDANAKSVTDKIEGNVHNDLLRGVMLGLINDPPISAIEAYRKLESVKEPEYAAEVASGGASGSASGVEGLSEGAKKAPAPTPAPAPAPAPAQTPARGAAMPVGPVETYRCSKCRRVVVDQDLYEYYGGLCESCASSYS